MEGGRDETSGGGSITVRVRRGLTHQRTGRQKELCRSDMQCCDLPSGSATLPKLISLRNPGRATQRSAAAPWMRFQSIDRFLAIASCSAKTNSRIWTSNLQQTRCQRPHCRSRTRLGSLEDPPGVSTPRRELGCFAFRACLGRLASEESSSARAMVRLFKLVQGETEPSEKRNATEWGCTYNSPPTL